MSAAPQAAAFEAAQAELPRLSALSRLRRSLEGSATPPALLAEVCGAIGGVLAFDAAALVLAPPGADVQSFVAAGAGLPAAGLPQIGLSEVGLPEGGQHGASFTRDALRRAWAVGEDAQLFSELTPLAAVGSGLRARIRQQGMVVGELLLWSRSQASYGEQERLFLLLVAGELASARERERLLTLDRGVALERERTLDAEASEQLLRALGGALNIRDVFPQVSAIANGVLPHDRLSMSFRDGVSSCVMELASNDDGPCAIRVTGIDPARFASGSFKIVRDLAADKPEATYDPPDARQQMVDAGYRSLMSVSMSAREQQFALHFWSKQRAAFAEHNVAAARRVAEHVALAVSHQQLAEAARRAADAQSRAERLEVRVQSLSEELDLRSGYGRIIGGSAPWRHALRAATQVALTDTTVLLTGESGTGKEVIARFIHRASGRTAGPFIAVNCAALPEQLLESELFGHERGAFTGAQQQKAGQIELASGGTLFLDEVGEMSPSAQAKVLRVLQEREFQRLGGTRLLKANVRVIAATNRELLRATTRGDFREDLYYRLQVFDIRLPPLRERAEDILPLSDAFLRDIGRLFGRPPAGMTREARQALLGYRWPGNVRELRNVLERAAIVSDGALIAPEHLSLQAEESAPAAVSTNVKAIERALVEQVLRECQGNKSEAARRLGLTRKQLYVRLRQYESEGEGMRRGALRA